MFRPRSTAFEYTVNIASIFGALNCLGTSTEASTGSRDLSGRVWDYLSPLGGKVSTGRVSLNLPRVGRGLYQAEGWSFFGQKLCSGTGSRHGGAGVLLAKTGYPL